MNEFEIYNNLLDVNNLDYLLVNSTNKFLVEYNDLQENSRYKLTKFSGSTGDVLFSKTSCKLFVDGRYHEQADNEVNHNNVDVVKLSVNDSFLDKLVENISPNSSLGIFAEKNSVKKFETLQNKLFKKNVKVVVILKDTLDCESLNTNSNITDVSQFCGLSSCKKLAILRENLANNKAYLFTNLEEVSYLTNLRDFSTDFTAKICAKAIVFNDKAYIFSDNKIENISENFQSLKSSDFSQFIKNKIQNYTFLIDKSTCNIHDFITLAENFDEMTTSPLKEMKSIKTDCEIEAYKKCFENTDKALLATRNYIYDNENISEYDISVELEKNFKKFGAKSLSFKSIVARNENSALAHYSKCAKNEIIKDGDLVLIDCGAYYESGLATDITRVFVKGEANILQKQTYTKVLKAFLNCFNACVCENTRGFDIDKIAREILKTNNGFSFSHGLGHGIGISVHEAPPNLSMGEIAKTTLKNNMTFTIEPGLYKKNVFGIRLENSCYLENDKIKSFTKFPYEEKLIDYSLLNEEETSWLKELQA